MLPCSVVSHLDSFSFSPKQRDEDEGEEERQQRAAGRRRGGGRVCVAAVGQTRRPRRVLLQFAGRQRLQVLQGAVGRHGELGVSGGQQVKDARLEVDVLHLQRLSALGGGTLHRVDLVGGPQGPQGPQGLGAGALQPRLLALPAQRVLLDELVAGAAVQAQLQAATVLREVQRVLGHPDGEGQVVAHAPHDDGRADVARLDLHLLPHRAGAGAALHDGQAAALAAAARPVLEGQRQVLGGGLVHLLVRAAVVRLEDHRDLETTDMSQ